MLEAFSSRGFDFLKLGQIKMNGNARKKWNLCGREGAVTLLFGSRAKGRREQRKRWKALRG
jgi:hypothetical protein